MNTIMPTIPSVYLKNGGSVQQPKMQMNNYGIAPAHSFSKQSPGLGSTLYGNTSLNNSAIRIINAYASGSTVNNTTNKKDSSNSSAKGVSTPSFFISKPNFSHTNSKVNIQFFYYTASLNSGVSSSHPARPTKIEEGFFKKEYRAVNNEVTTGSFRKDFSELSVTLAQLYQKEVNIIVTRLYYPYLNSHILSQYLAYNAPSNTFMDFQEAILTNPSLHKTNLPAHISGIKVQVSGRLVTETVIPRITVKSCLIGSFLAPLRGASSVNNTTQIIDYSKYTTKNELGAFSVKVWICQRSSLA